MERKTLKFIIDTLDGEREVEIVRVMNYVADEYAKITEKLASLGEVMAELRDLTIRKKEVDIELGSIIATKEMSFKERRAAADPLKAERIEIIKQIKVANKAVREINKGVTLESVFHIIRGILKDNRVKGDLLEYEYWHTRVVSGEGWRFIQACIMKDVDASKKKVTR